MDGRSEVGHSSGHGGGASRASSPGSTRSTRNVVGSYSLDGIPVEWDNHPAIRERIREQCNLCLAYDPETTCGNSGYVNATIENVKVNAPVLEPLAARMAANSLRLPSIEQLIKAISDFFILAKLSRSDEHCYQEAWAIRRLIGRLKKFTYRSCPPQDPEWFNSCTCVNNHFNLDWLMCHQKKISHESRSLSLIVDWMKHQIPFNPSKYINL